MKKVEFSASKSFESFRSLKGSMPGASRAFATPTPRPSSESSLGSFANLKLTAEKLVKEQASVKMDLELANSKLKKAVEQIHLLEVKLRDTNNANAKLRVKQREDEKLWRGLDSKLSSTKTLCEQLTETLQYLAGQTRHSEEDKKLLEEKLLENSKSLDDLTSKMNHLSEKLDHAKENTKKWEQEMSEVQQKGEEIMRTLEAERCATEDLKKEKDDVIKKLLNNIEENKVHLEGVNSEMQGLLQELRLKEVNYESLELNLNILNKEKSALQSLNDELAKRLLDSISETENLESVVHLMKLKVAELDEYSITVSSNLNQMYSSMETCYKLAQRQKDLAVKSAQMKLEHLQNQHMCVVTENEVSKAENETLRSRITELQKMQEFVMVQHADECRLAEDKIRTLESEMGNLVEKKKDLEMLVSKLEEKILHLSDSSSMNENKMQAILLKVSCLESENKDMQHKMQLMLQENSEKLEKLHNVSTEYEQQAASLENQRSELQCLLDEKEKSIMQLMEGKKLLEQQKSEKEMSLASADVKLNEAKKQFEQMLENKRLELAKHLKDISQKNDQAINDIRKKYEMDKLEIVKAETEKVRKMQQEYDQKELKLRTSHVEEMQRIQLQAENELRERTLSLKKEHEIQIKCLTHQHEDEYGKLQEELELQRSKEEKQRALLELQWKVMDEKSQQNEVEVNSKKEYSVSSIKKRGTDVQMRNQLPSIGSVKRKKDVDISGIMRTPVAKMLRKVEKGNPGSIVSVPKHSRKVTHHEYEIETSNGKTIKTHKKTKSTVMFGNSAERKRMKRNTPQAKKDVPKVAEYAEPRASNIGDLFSEGSLNPYTEDPYAFD